MTNDCFLKLSVLNILISGQALTSRTETVENYLKSRVKSLGVIAIANPYSPPGTATSRFYREGDLIWEKPVSNLYFLKKHSQSYASSRLYLLYFFYHQSRVQV